MQLKTVPRHLCHLSHTSTRCVGSTAVTPHSPAAQNHSSQSADASHWDLPAAPTPAAKAPTAAAATASTAATKAATATATAEASAAATAVAT